LPPAAAQVKAAFPDFPVALKLDGAEGTAHCREWF
jgi:hypothetical protein